MKKSKWRITAFWGIFTLALDLASKYLAGKYINPWEPLEVIPGFFNLILTHNPGAASSLLANWGGGSPEAQGLKMAGLAAVSLLPFIYFYVKARPGDRMLLAALGLIWGGALGNIHDRLRWNAVVDFLDVYIGAYHWPAFNAADIGICVGAGLLALSVLFDKPRVRERETS
ncbi:MAG: signal peptidase II [Candidatus Adiutrix sp.]|nr:signal peptidase II [Candidatus Adiutrix sp.]